MKNIKRIFKKLTFEKVYFQNDKKYNQLSFILWGTVYYIALCGTTMLSLSEILNKVIPMHSSDMFSFP